MEFNFRKGDFEVGVKVNVAPLWMLLQLLLWASTHLDSGYLS